MPKIDRRSVWGVLLISLLAWPVPVLAAGPTSGISLSPFEEQVSIQPTDTSKSFELILGNHTSIPQTLHLKTQDFGQLNANGGVKLESNNSYTKHYGLAAWLSLGETTVNLGPGATVSVPVTVHNTSSLGSGGHYGAVVVNVGGAANSQIANQVGVNEQLLSLILVDKVGGDHYDLALTSANTNGNWRRLPTTASLMFQNPGNVHVVPRGLVKLSSPTGTLIAQGIINTQSAYVLPGTSRDLEVSLTPLVRAAPIPGLYRLTVQYRYDGIAVYATKHYWLDYLNAGSWAVIGVVVVVGLGWILTRRPRRPTA